MLQSLSNTELISRSSNPATGGTGVTGARSKHPATQLFMWRCLPQHRYGLRRREQRQLHHLLSLIWIYHSVQVQGDLRANDYSRMHLKQPLGLICREAVLFFERAFKNST